MITHRSIVSCVALVLGFVLLVASGCANLNDPYSGGGGGYGINAPYYGGNGNGGGVGYGGYGNGGYGNGGYGNGGYGNGGYNNNRREQQELERERERLENERKRLQRERENVYRAPAAPPPPPPRQVFERCPAGFSPSERKCTQDERRRGCRDMRLPGGLGCVDR